MRHASSSVSFFALACALGCSSSSSGNPGGNTGGDAGNGSDTGSSGSDSGSMANCGSQNCSTTQYCELSASKDSMGNLTWNPSMCVAIPSGCTPPADPSTCTTDPTPCDPAMFCSCLQQKDGSCPTSGVVSTQCQETTGGLFGFGCTGM